MKDTDWNEVSDLIDRWGKRCPEEMQENLAWVKNARDGLDDKEFGTGSTGSLRMGLILHPNLVAYIEEFYPHIFSDNRNIKEFANKFKKFAIPEKY